MTVGRDGVLARRRFFNRAGHGVLFGALGGVILGLPSWGLGLPWGPPAALGATLAVLLFLLEKPFSSSAGSQLDPASDPSGALRASLSVDSEHPFHGRLEEAAGAVRPRFLPMTGFGPLAAATGGLVLVALWVQAGPSVPGPSALGGTAGGGETLSGAETAFDGEEESSVSVAPPAPVESDSGLLGPGESWEKVEATRPDVAALMPGRDFGGHREVVERYLRLKAAKP